MNTNISYTECKFFLITDLWPKGIILWCSRFNWFFVSHLSTFWFCSTHVHFFVCSPVWIDIMKREKIKLFGVWHQLVCIAWHFRLIFFLLCITAFIFCCSCITGIGCFFHCKPNEYHTRYKLENILFCLYSKNHWPLSTSIKLKSITGEIKKHKTPFY